MFKNIFKLTIELVEQIKNKKIFSETMHMEAYGLKLSGQGYLIDAYTSMDHEKFLLTLKTEVDFVKKYRNKEKINIIDIGANLGFYSVVYAMNEGVDVISFEPFPDTFEYLEKNIKLNNILNVYPFQMGLFSKNEDMPIGSSDAFNFYGFFTKIIKFTDKKQVGCYSVYTSDNQAPIAKFVKGDECLILSEKEHIDFIKIDVEGSELEVIKGLEATILKHHPILRIEFSLHALSAAGISYTDLWNYLIQLGYENYDICSNEEYLTNLTFMEVVPEIKGSKDFIFI